MGGLPVVRHWRKTTVGVCSGPVARRPWSPPGCHPHTAARDCGSAWTKTSACRCTCSSRIRLCLESPRSEVRKTNGIRRTRRISAGEINYSYRAFLLWTRPALPLQNWGRCPRRTGPPWTPSSARLWRIPRCPGPRGVRIPRKLPSDCRAWSTIPASSGKGRKRTTQLQQQQ